MCVLGGGGEVMGARGGDLKLATSTGKAILLKDLSNINSRMKKVDRGMT